MDEKTAAALRAAFPTEVVGKRPQLTCRDCSQARTKNCDQHAKHRCGECGQWISTSHIHLDYVGHADITDRFLQVDPDWSWEPVERQVDPQLLGAAIATGDGTIVDKVLQASPPKFDSNGGLWIRLTIAGVTRLGYGDAAGKTGPNAIKEAIGDGLRNAGMRFGAGLDMWRKEPTSNEAAHTGQPPAVQRTNASWLASMEKRLAAANSEEELRTLANELEAKVQAGVCEQADYERLWELGEQRFREVQSRPPMAPPTAEQPPTSPSSDEVAAMKAAFDDRLAKADTLEALEALKKDVMAAFSGQSLGVDEGNRLLRDVKSKQRDVGTKSAP